MILCTKFGWNLMKSVKEIVFRISWNRKFCKVHRMTGNQTQGIGHQKCPTYVHCINPSPKFCPFRSTISLFETFHILGFPLTPILKFQSATIFLKLGRLPRKVTACIAPWCPHVLIKFGWYEMKTVGVIAFEISSPIWSCVNKKNWQIAKKVTAYINPWLWYFVWSLVEIWWKVLKE